MTNEKQEQDGIAIIEATSEEIEYWDTVIDKPLATQTKKRVCKHPGCKTILSSYNSSDYCFLHKEPEPYVLVVEGDYPEPWNRRERPKCLFCGKEVNKHRYKFCSVTCCSRYYAKRKKKAKRTENQQKFGNFFFK